MAFNDFSDSTSLVIFVLCETFDLGDFFITVTMSVTTSVPTDSINRTAWNKLIVYIINVHVVEHSTGTHAFVVVKEIQNDDPNLATRNYICQLSGVNKREINRSGSMKYQTTRNRTHVLKILSRIHEQLNHMFSS